MVLGFCHGVLNTDKLTIVGLLDKQPARMPRRSGVGAG